MPIANKSQILAFAKKTAQPPLVAAKLQQKRAAVAAPPAMPPPAAARPPAPPPAPGMGGEGEGEEAYIFELVEEAAEAAEAARDADLEDAIAGTPPDATADTPPQWASDPDKWREAAEAVGLGADAEDKYAEPVVVAAYLYKMIGGPVNGVTSPPLPEGAEPLEEENQPKPPAQPMGKPGSAAKAMQAKAAVARGEPHPDRAAAAPPPPAKGPPGAAPPKVAAKPKPGAPAPEAKGAGVGNPALGQPPVHGKPGEGAEPNDELKAMIDDAANEAKVSPDPELSARLKGYDPARDGNPPQWATDPDKWAQAEEAVKLHWASYEEPYAVVAHVYKKMGGGVS